MCKNQRTVLNEVGVTEYNEISDVVTYEEYDVLPCKYLSAILRNNNSDINYFINVMKLFRRTYR